jgi:two-component system OmpR family sensor kinase
LRARLRSVQWLQQQITERSSSNLQPLVLQDLPLELRQVGEGVNQLMDRLHQALDVERALAANAAHELRTPLASVRLRLHTAVEQAQLQGSTQIAVGEAQTALTALETLSHRTERLLQLSRAEAGNTALSHRRPAAAGDHHGPGSGSPAPSAGWTGSRPRTRPRSGCRATWTRWPLRCAT